MAAIGMEVADCPRETPPTKTTASKPSRNTTTKGSVNNAHFPILVPPVVSTSRYINTCARDLTLDLTLTLESVLKFDAPFSLRMIQFEHGNSHDKDQDSSDQLKYSCELYLTHFNIRCRGELTLPKIFGFFIEVRRFGEPYSDKHGTDYNSKEKAERGTKKDLKSVVSDM